MLNFVKLTLNDIHTVRPYFSLSASNICDNTVGGSFMWRDYFMAEYAQHNGTLIFMVKLRYHGNATAFTFPVGRDIYGSIKEIDGYCRQNGIPMVFCAATESDIDVIRGIYKNVECIFNPDWSDYLYNKEDLVSLPGRKYSGQRNHINFFKKNYPGYGFSEISAENLPAVKAFYNEMISGIDDIPEIFHEEIAKTVELLDNYDAYGLFGGALFVENGIVAFSIGEIVNDTLFVHVERADNRYRGAYQMIMNLFVTHYAQPGIVYVNREEDVGDEGLRNAKNALHPAGIAKKYTVIVNG